MVADRQRRLTRRLRYPPATFANPVARPGRTSQSRSTVRDGDWLRKWQRHPDRCAAIARSPHVPCSLRELEEVTEYGLNCRQNLRYRRSSRRHVACPVEPKWGGHVHQLILPNDHP